MPLTRYTDPVLELWSVIARRPKINPESHRSPIFPKPIASWKKYFGLKNCCQFRSIIWPRWN